MTCYTLFHLSNSPRGYIAVVSAIILSAVLITLTFTESTSTFWSRYDQVDQENHERSFLLAESCAYEALLQDAEDPDASSSNSAMNENILFDSDTCNIDSIGSTITTHAITQHSYAGVVVSTATNVTSGILSITSWRDITSIPP